MAGSPWAFLPFIEHLLGNETKRNLPVRSEVVQKRESLRLRNSTLVTFLSVKIKLVTAISCNAWTIVFLQTREFQDFCVIFLARLPSLISRKMKVIYRASFIE